MWPVLINYIVAPPMQVICACMQPHLPEKCVSGLNVTWAKARSPTMQRLQFSWPILDPISYMLTWRQGLLPNACHAPHGLLGRKGNVRAPMKLMSSKDTSMISVNIDILSYWVAIKIKGFDEQWLELASYIQFMLCYKKSIHYGSS